MNSTVLNTDKNCINFNIFYSLFCFLSLHFILFSSPSPVPSLLPLFLSLIPLNLSHPLKPPPPISPIVRLAQLLSISSAAINLTQPRSISLMVSPSPITADLTPRPPSISPSSLSSLSAFHSASLWLWGFFLFVCLFVAI